MEEARDVIDMLSLESDAEARENTIVSYFHMLKIYNHADSQKDFSMSIIETSLLKEAESNSSWGNILTQGRPRFF